jgi:flagellar hook-length control protein FliK
MPQMPAVLPNVSPSTPQARPPGSSGSNDQSHFSPHLENAVSGKKLRQQAPQTNADPKTSPDTEQKSAATALQTAENKPKIVVCTTAENALELESAAETADEKSDQTSLLLHVPENIQRTFPSFVTELHPAEFHAKQHSTASAGIAIQVSGSLAIASEMQAERSEALSSGQQTQGVAGKQDALMNQLQELIASSKDTQPAYTPKAERPAIPISVDKNFYSSLNASLAGKMETASVSASAITADSNQNGLLLADGDSLTFTPGKPMHQLTGIRHDSQQQYFATKINVETETDNMQSFQDSSPDGERAQQTTGSALANSPFSATEQSSTFSTIAPQAQETVTQSTIESVKPIILPSGVIVHEHEVLQQLAERFRLSSKNIDSRINLKLHPAELGELKIDLTLKDGAIRANIVAHSQNTLEILEKNLPKLKTMLENQGFDIDQIELTAESESVSDFDLFDRQLFSNNNHDFGTQKGRQKEEAAFTLDDIPFTVPTTNSGVNVKI